MLIINNKNYNEILEKHIILIFLIITTTTYYDYNYIYTNVHLIYIYNNV